MITHIPQAHACGYTLALATRAKIKNCYEKLQIKPAKLFENKRHRRGESFFAGEFDDKCGNHRTKCRSPAEHFRKTNYSAQSPLAVQRKIDARSLADEF